MSRMGTCTDCEGTGLKDGSFCVQCNGTGQILLDYVGGIADVLTGQAAQNVEITDIKDKCTDIKDKADDIKEVVDAIWDKVK